MNIIVTGSRKFPINKKSIEFFGVSISSIVNPFDIYVMMNGDCDGLDKLSQLWCKGNDIHYCNVPALWDTRPVAAGPCRNMVMCKILPTATVAAFPLPGSKGTHSCIGIAKKLGMNVKVFNYEY